MSATKEARFEPGIRYHDRAGRICTVRDILTTRNMAGEIVRIRYLADHEFMGQRVVDSDVLETTIARNMITYY